MISSPLPCYTVICSNLISLSRSTSFERDDLLQIILMYSKLTHLWYMASNFNHKIEEDTMKIKSLVKSAIILFSFIAIFNSSIAMAEIHVYDNNNQYLGIVMEMGPEHVEIFIPSLGARWQSNLNFPSGCPGDVIYFESADCTDTAYSNGPNPTIYDSGNLLGGFYKRDYSGKETIAPESAYNSNCECIQLTAWPSADYYPLTQPVQMPFTTPIAQPLRFEVRNRAVVIPLN